jgi:hypothetical protein
VGEIQRWEWLGDVIDKADSGDWVTYADHVAHMESLELRLGRHYEQVTKAAVAEAEQEKDRIWQMRIEAGGYLLTLNQPTLNGLFDAHYERGQRDARRETWPESMAAAEMRIIEKAVAAVEGLFAAPCPSDEQPWAEINDALPDIIAAIKAVGGE